MEAVEYAVAGLADLPEIAELLAQAFSQAEPPAVAMGLSFEDLRDLVLLIGPSILNQGLTVIARGADTHALAGVMLTDDFAVPLSLDMAQLSPKFLPIFAMLENLDEQFRHETAYAPGQCLHLFMLATSPEFAGRGVGRVVVEACVANGIAKGYTAAVTEATGVVSQHIFRRCGFAERFSVAYRDFVYEGETVFASIREHEKAILMQGLLG